MEHIIASIKTFIRNRKSGSRTPAQRAVSLALTGAVMIWTPDGNVVVEPNTARSLAQKLNRLADLAEQPVRLS